MEPVVLPRGIAPVLPSSGIRKVAPRGDSRRDSEFARQLKKRKQKDADPEAGSEEEPAAQNPEPASAAPSDGAGAPAEPEAPIEGEKKLIDIRV